MALDSSNWIKICLDSSWKILESCPLMSLWLFLDDFEQIYAQCIMSAVRLYLISSPDVNIILFQLWILLILLSSYSPWSYHIHPDRALSVWENPAKFMQFRSIYCFFKPEKLSQTQRIRKKLIIFCLKAYFQTWLRFAFVFSNN